MMTVDTLSRVDAILPKFVKHTDINICDNVAAGMRTHFVTISTSRISIIDLLTTDTIVLVVFNKI